MREGARQLAEIEVSVGAVQVEAHARAVGHRPRRRLHRFQQHHLARRRGEVPIQIA